VIYVRRDPALIPEKIIKVAERAQKELEALPAQDRVAFIRRKSHVWTAFKKYLAKMSYGKCWYSESNDPQSFFDVDHFRPKSEAIRDDNGTRDDGYPWLAFDWDNFRYSAGRSNRLSTDENTDKTAGKSSWFPVCTGSQVADWDQRNIAVEQPIILDPTNPNDAQLVKIGASGLVEPSEICFGRNRERASKSVRILGLDLPNLVEARLRVMREVQEQVDILIQTMSVANGAPQVADGLPIPQSAELIRRKTLPNSPYSLAARCKLIELGMPYLIARPEEIPPYPG
jgi:hypothetical protein